MKAFTGCALKPIGGMPITKTMALLAHETEFWMRLYVSWLYVDDLIWLDADPIPMKLGLRHYPRNIDASMECRLILRCRKLTYERTR